MNLRSFIFIAFALLCYQTSFATEHQFHHPADELNKLQNDKQRIAKLYQQYCANCHAADPLIELGAPKFRNKHDWKKKLKKPYKKLVRHMIEGHHAMPARGGCFECDDETLILIMTYMLPTKKKHGT